MGKNKGIAFFICIFLSFITTYSKTNYFGRHQTKLELSESDYQETSDITFIPAQGKIGFYNNDIKFDGNLKYKIATSTNSEYDENMDYKAFGGIWQYNGISGATLGIKGALDYDYMFVSKDSYYTRFEKEDYLTKTGNLQSEQSFGIKFYANKYYDINDKITAGLWNEYAVTKIEKNSYSKLYTYPNSDLEVDTDNSYLTITPRILYIQEWGKLKFVGEAYVDIRKYFKGVVELSGDEKDFFYKTIINPQIIYNRESEKITAFLYSNVENEKMMTIDFWQHLFKVTPRFEYRPTEKWRLGVSGAGYEKQEELGINFDNDELFGVKLADTYEAQIFALRLYAEYSFTEKWAIGNEIITRTGKWEDGDLGQYLDEETNIVYLKYDYKYSDKGEIVLKTSYELYRNSTDIAESKVPVEENMYRITAEWNYYM